MVTRKTCWVDKMEKQKWNGKQKKRYMELNTKCFKSCIGPEWVNAAFQFGQALVLHLISGIHTES